MKKRLTALMAVVFVLALALTALAGQGNNSPQGTHYTVNIHAGDNCPATDNSNNSIFVTLGYHDATPNVFTNVSQLNKRNKIFLVPGPTFEILDPIACLDNDGAVLQLPADVLTKYTIWARAMGSKGSATITPCFIDTSVDPNQYICATGNTVTLEPSNEKGNGTGKFQNVTTDLLSACYFINGTGNPCVTVSIFSNPLYQFYWDYDNYGLRMAQLRFYPNPVE